MFITNHKLIIQVGFLVDRMGRDTYERSDSYMNKDMRIFLQNVIIFVLLIIIGYLLYLM